MNTIFWPLLQWRKLLSSFQGKYVEILFTSGQPKGGKVSNFLLEKSRVVMQNSNERNFHIFYQLVSGMDQDTKNQFGLVETDYYNYLNQNNCYTVREILLFFNHLNVLITWWRKNANIKFSLNAHSGWWYWRRTRVQRYYGCDDNYGHGHWWTKWCHSSRFR